MTTKEPEHKKYKIHYLSCHSVLEYYEVSLFAELGHTVFSNGAYSDPKGYKSLPRPMVNLEYSPEYEKLAKEHPKTKLPLELIDPFDIIYIAHTPEWVNENWEKIKHKKVIWRSIGQSTRHVENMIRKARYEGLRIVRYSPFEQNIPDYLGADAIIRFSIDENEFKDWNGKEKRVINFTQSLKGRRTFCHYDDIMAAVNGFPALVYGSGNDDLGYLNGGELPYDLMKGALRDNQVFVYGGTWPAPYTLTFMEAFMTGIPVVSIGENMAERIEQVAQSERLEFFEIPSIITNGVNGYVFDDIQSLRNQIHQLLEDYELAKKIGEAGRKRAIELFGKEKIKGEWQAFFDKI